MPNIATGSLEGTIYEGFVYEAKQGKKYVNTFECHDAEQTYRDLAHEMIAKKINDCRWIKSIKRTPLYNGYDRITVTYDHGGRRIYTIKSN